MIFFKWELFSYNWITNINITKLFVFGLNLKIVLKMNSVFLPNALGIYRTIAMVLYIILDAYKLNLFREDNIFTIKMFFL